ncbi:MAG: ABC transporter ATP-binding protein [Spirochaetales bacterium]|nr:ABC transporter ATP-binding protein [Spirochaetales bacterium]
MAGVGFLVLTNFGQIAIPQFIKQAVDMVTGGAINMRSIGTSVLWIVILAVAVAIGRFGWRIFLLGVSRKVEKGLREEIFSKLLKLSSTFFGKMKTGDILARATNDMDNVRSASGWALISAIDGIFMTIAILIIIFSQYPKLALLTILPLPIITILVLGMGKALGTRFRKVQEAFAGVSAHVQEALSGIRVIKSFVREKYTQEKFEERNDFFLKRNMSLVRIWGFFFPLITFLTGLTALLLLRFGGVAVIEGNLTAGEFVAFLAYLEMLAWPMLGAGFTVNIIQRGGASLGRINAILREEPDIQGPDNGLESFADMAIEVRNLSYTYPETGEQVLDDVSFNIPEGTIFGILGRTGSGKSTLIRCLPRLLDPPQGSVTIGGTEIHEYDLSFLRSSIGMVPQETFLFSATVKENIAFGFPDAGEDAIFKAAALSTIDRDLRDFPAGYETEVGERGITLSGGQKQRIAISRAILVNPEILVFDDALSAVDAETEASILSEFLEKRKGRTAILISQRISTLDQTDKVIVLEGGRISQQGPPSQLMQGPGLYRDISRLQLIEKEADL